MYLITGAAGFIGFHVANALLQRGYLVHGVDNLNDYYDVSLKQDRLHILNQHKNFSFSKLDLSHPTDTHNEITRIKPKKIIHLAAQAGVRASFTHPQNYVSANLNGFMNILDAAKNLTQLDHFIYASSSSVYGDAGTGPRALNAACNDPISLYAATKRSGELLAASYFHMHNFPTTGLRFFTVYGSWGRPDMAYYSFTKSIMNSQKLIIYVDGTAARDFTHISDIVNGIISVSDLTPVQHQLFNLGNDHPETVNTLITLLENITGKKADIVYQDKLKGEVQKTWADISKSREIFGYQPKTNLTTGLNEFITWYKTYHS